MTNIIVSLLVTAAACFLLTEFVDQSGVFGILLAIPLALMVRAKGRWAGLGMAAFGVVFNAFVNVSVGSGGTILSEHPAVFVLRSAAEALAFAGVVLGLSRKEGDMLLPGLAVGVILADVQGRVTLANSAAETIFSAARGSLVGRSVKDLLPDPGPVRAHGAPLVYEAVLTPSNGEVRRVQVTMNPRRDGSGRDAGAVATLQDVTDRAAAWERLDEDRSRLQTLVTNLPDAVYLKDRQSRFILANPALAHLLNVSDPRDVIGKTDRDFFPADQAAENLEDENRLMAERQPILNKVEPRRIQESLRVVMSTKMPVVGQDGAVKGLVGISRDVTKLRLMEESLRESEEHYRNTFMNAPFGVFHSTRLGKLISANPAMARMLGYDSAHELIETVNRKDMASVLYEDPQDHRALIDAAQRGDTIWHNTASRFHRKDGEVLQAIVTFRRYHRPGAAAMELEAFIEDVSERERAEGEREKLQKQLQQAQKMEAVGRLAGGIAHDFNNILTAIYGYCDVGLRWTTPGDKLRGIFTEVRQSAERAAKLTSQLLAFSRRRIVQPRTVELGELVAGMMDMLRRLLGEDVTVQTQRLDGLWPILVDPGQVEQVIMNLVVNARDAMPRGGLLSIEIANASLGDEFIREHAEVKPGEYVLLSVRDTGTGMDAATMARIYEPFFTTKDVGKGTGLGLSTVYGIVKQSGGYVYCTSEIGKGTTFAVYFPRSAAPREPELLDRPHLSGALTGNEAILFVDDDDAVREVGVSLLETAGYRVFSAQSGDEALRVAETLAVPPDLLIADVVMPGLNGVEMAQRLREKFPPLRVLYLTGYTEDAVVRHGLERGEVALLQKPFTATDLLQHVRSSLEGR